MQGFLLVGQICRGKRGQIVLHLLLRRFAVVEHIHQQFVERFVLGVLQQVLAVFLHAVLKILGKACFSHLHLVGTGNGIGHLVRKQICIRETEGSVLHVFRFHRLRGLSDLQDHFGGSADSGCVEVDVHSVGKRYACMVDLGRLVHQPEVAVRYLVVLGSARNGVADRQHINTVDCGSSTERFCTV